MRTSRSAFTLLETVIAMGIAVVMLGASVSARQFLIQSSQLTEQRTIMASLADQSIDMVRMARQAYPSFGTTFGLSGLNPSEYLLFYTKSTSASGNNNAELGWCVLAAVPVCPAGTMLPVETSGASGSNLIAKYVATKAEVVAVSNQSNVLSGPQVVDGTTYTQAQITSAGPIIVTNARYSFYNRQISITQVTDSPISANTTQAYVSYKITVTVWPYGETATNGSNTVTRSEILSDQAGAPL